MSLRKTKLPVGGESSQSESRGSTNGQAGGVIQQSRGRSQIQDRAIQRLQRLLRAPQSQRRGGETGCGLRGGLLVPSEACLSSTNVNPTEAMLVNSIGSSSSNNFDPSEAKSVPFEAISLSRKVDPTKAHLAQQHQDISLHRENHASESPKPPQRPGKGTVGSRCLVKANHFLAELSDRDLHKYNVSITPEVVSPATNRAVMMELIHLYKESHLGNRLPAYDGRYCLYTAGRLPFLSKEFVIILTDEREGDRPAKVNKEFRVAIRLASRTDVRHLRTYLEGNNSGDEAQEALQVLDTVLRQMSNLRYLPLGRTFYSLNPRGRQSLGNGLESWRGFYQSIRPTQRGLSLNVDISATAFIEPLPVCNFVEELLERNISGTVLSKADCRKITTVLKGVKVKVMHRGHMQRTYMYRIFGLTSQSTGDLRFMVDGSMKPLVDYFRDTYQVSIQNTQWPCLQVGNPKRARYLPMEVCQIVEGQRQTKKLTEKQITSLLKATCQRPMERQAEIVETINNNAYEEDPYTKEFGIHISNELATVEARVLPTPWLKYHETGQQQECLPRVGKWNMVGKKLVNAGRVQNWICINFARNVREASADDFCYRLAFACLECGMQFNRQPVLPSLSAPYEQVERVLKERYFEATTKLKRNELDFLIVILPDHNGSLYGDVKRICETELGITSQCCKAKNVLKMNHQVLESLVLKINVKVGGRNTVLVDAIARQIPIVSELPTIIFGADVAHPYLGEYSSSSFSAVVASQDWPEITTYAGLVSAQPYREEVIKDLFNTRGNASGGMIREHLISFRRETGHKPQRIIYYRDGISLGQFSQVLIHEVDAIRQACNSLEDNYQPRITFIVVQKGHHTKLFPYHHGDPNSADRTGNILPGTVVDSNICHPRGFDFYLCSHAGMKGTSNPAHYHVLWDENKFSADALQTLTYSLCYTYARCTRSVSIVPPVYYAHLAATRGRFYVDPTDDAGARTRVRGTVRPLPALKENIKRVMFYC